jgi:hypothetical protein
MEALTFLLGCSSTGESLLRLRRILANRDWETTTLLISSQVQQPKPSRRPSLTLIIDRGDITSASRIFVPKPCSAVLHRGQRVSYYVSMSTHIIAQLVDLQIYLRSLRLHAVGQGYARDPSADSYDLYRV